MNIWCIPLLIRSMLLGVFFAVGLLIGGVIGHEIGKAKGFVDGYEVGVNSRDYQEAKEV